VVSIIAEVFRKAIQRTALQALSVRQNVAKTVVSARDCGSQRRAACVPQAIRTMLYVSALIASAGGEPTETAQNCD